MRMAERRSSLFFITCPGSKYVILDSPGVAAYDSNVTHVKSAQIFSLKGKLCKKPVGLAEGILVEVKWRFSW
jgi:hypothetical protein